MCVYICLRCNDHFIHPKAMKKAREVHSQLLDIMKTQHVAHVSSSGVWDVVRKAICSSYFYNRFVLHYYKYQHYFVNFTTLL